MKDRRPKSVKPLDLGIVLRQQEIRSLDAFLLVCKKAGRLWRRSVVDRGLWDAGENCRNLLLFVLLTPQTDDWRTGIGFASGDIFPLAYTLTGKKALVCTDFRFLHPRSPGVTCRIFWIASYSTLAGEGAQDYMWNVNVGHKENVVMLVTSQPLKKPQGIPLKAFIFRCSSDQHLNIDLVLFRSRGIDCVIGMIFIFDNLTDAA